MSGRHGDLIRRRVHDLLSGVCSLTKGILTLGIGHTSRNSLVVQVRRDIMLIGHTDLRGRTNELMHLPWHLRDARRGRHLLRCTLSHLHGLSLMFLWCFDNISKVLFGSLSLTRSLSS